MSIFKTKILLLGVFLALSTWNGTAVARATALAMPKDRPVLTVSGKIAVTNKGDAAEFDRTMLEALGMESFTTSTPWYSGPTTFEGVPMAKLLDRLGASGEHLMVMALNDYSSDIPVSDVRKYKVLLALKVNGEYISVRDKGPLFIIYPFDTDPELQHQTYYGRSVWQVFKIIVK
ncbi:molybdopterin-dependent oxidoreductase [Microvirga makkahensis]|uniref:Molybdopterin-dependent oxidoreductase n=1 Tax=Microvirga makkahensis TaxID=1128670 RepID=A0A7X3MRM6_9HYPH|nr:molybdopterin-dependent oxidoreductase [Microvirga makkahensis]MXQ11966.1 molybdopterin-dependent oxidoreductase [Microvirga makkahensis]